MKNITKLLPYENIVADYAVNYRLTDNYKLDIMEHQLITSGQVNNPLHVEYIKDSNPPRYLVLQGNRRYRAVGLILDNPKYTEDQKRPFRKLNCIIHEGLSPEERADLIADHGSAEPLCREETVAAIWRHMLLGKTEEQIGMQFYSQLANYTGEQKRLNQLPPITQPEERRKKIKEWFAGTLRGQIMSAYRMGEFVQKQFLLSRRKEDGRLNVETDVIEMFCSTKRIQRLAKARSDDEKAGVWNYDIGGPTFNPLIEEFKNEDATGKKPVADKGVKKETLQTWSDVYKATPVRLSMKAAMGDESAAQELQKVNNTWLAVNERLEELRKLYVRIKDDNMREFVKELLGDGPLGGFTTALEPFLTDYIVCEPLMQPALTVHETVDPSEASNTPTDGGETVIASAEEPTAEEPTAEEPTAEEPTAEEPTAEEPTAEEPTAEEPTEPVAEVVPEFEEEVEETHHKTRAHAHSGRRGKGKGK